MKLPPPHITCSTCDDYCFVPGPDGFHKVRCPDCQLHCPVHGSPVVVGGQCLGCAQESNVAEALFTRAQRVSLGIESAA